MAKAKTIKQLLDPMTGEKRTKEKMDIAIKCGVHFNTVTNWHTGKSPINKYEHILSVAKHLGITTEEFINELEKEAKK